MKKKVTTSLLAVVLVLILCLGLFAACDNDDATKYTVTYSLGEYTEGQAPAAQSAAADSTVKLQAAPTWEGHNFLGWKAEGSEDLLQAGDDYTVTGNVTLTAQWDTQSTPPQTTQYTVTYDLGDYDGSEQAPTPQTVDENTSVQLKSAPTWDGHPFLGWQAPNSTDLLQAGANYTVTGNVTLTAQWDTQSTPPQTTQYTVTYDLGEYEGSEQAPTPQTVDENTSVQLKSAPTWDGHPFLGWQAPDSTDLLQAGANYLVTGNITLTAQWDTQSTPPQTTQYTVTYDLGDYDGSEQAPTPQTVDDNTTVQLKSAPTWDGHPFLGWKAEGSDDLLQAGANYLVTGNVTLTAQWDTQSTPPQTTQYTVTYDLGEYEGSEQAPTPQTVDENTSVQLKSAPTWDGHPFLGWQAPDSTDLLQAGANYTVTGNVTLTAQWDTQSTPPQTTQYTVTYDLGDYEGSEQAPTPQTVDENTTVQLKSAPTWDGHPFLGWKAEGSDDLLQAGANYLVTGNVTLTAQWDTQSTPPATVTIDPAYDGVWGYADQYSTWRLEVSAANGTMQLTSEGFGGFEIIASAAEGNLIEIDGGYQISQGNYSYTVKLTGNNIVIEDAEYSGDPVTLTKGEPSTGGDAKFDWSDSDLIGEFELDEYNNSFEALDFNKITITATQITLTLTNGDEFTLQDDDILSYDNYYGFTFMYKGTSYTLTPIQYEPPYNAVLLGLTDEVRPTTAAEFERVGESGPSVDPSQWASLIGTYEGDDEDSSTHYIVDITATEITVTIGDGDPIVAQVTAFDEYEGFTLLLNGKEYFL